MLAGLPADLAQVAPDALAALRALSPVIGQLETVFAQLTTIAKSDGLHALDGSKSLPAYLTRHLPVSRRRVQASTATGQALRDHLPETAVAARAGSLGWDSAMVLAKTITSDPTIAGLDVLVPADASLDKVVALVRQAQPPATEPAIDAEADLADAADAAGQPADGWVRCEQWLVGQGRRRSVARFQNLVKTWAAMVDPDAFERAYRVSEADAYLAAGQTLDCCHLQGKLAPEGGQVLLRALDAFRPKLDADHPRGIQERNAEALETIARIALETNQTHQSPLVRPHVAVTIPWETFLAMATHTGTPASQLAAMGGLDPARWAENTGPIPASLMAAIACDSDITRIVFGPAGQIINLGRTERVITPALRAAVIARDTHCVFPGCEAPPLQCQAHHLHRWSHGGKTDIGNLALLCRYHHRFVHANNITITPRHTPNDQTKRSKPPRPSRLGTPNTPPHPRNGPDGNPPLGADPPPHTGQQPHSGGPDVDDPELDPPNLGDRAPHAQAPGTSPPAQGSLLDAEPAYNFTNRHGERIT